MDKSLLLVRLAARADYEALLNVRRDEEDGDDYLKKSFNHLMNNKHVSIFVLQEGTTVVGLRILVALNDEDCLGLDARIAKHCSNKGYMTILDSEAMKIFKQTYPKMKNVLWAVINSGRYQKWLKDPSRKPEWKLLTRRNCILFFPNKKDMQNLIIGMKEPRRAVSIETGSELLTENPQQVRKLFPDEVYLDTLWWLPRKVSNENLLKTMISHHTLSTRSTGGQLEALSFADASYGNNVTLYDLFFHGHEKDDMMDHILHQLKHLVTIMPDDQNAEVELVFPLHIDSADIKETLQPYLGTTHLVIQTADTVKEEVLVLQTQFGSFLGLSRL